jgi:hypothetical protein
MEAIHRFCEGGGRMVIVWVKSHNGTPGNEACDFLAGEITQNPKRFATYRTRDINTHVAKSRLKTKSRLKAVEKAEGTTAEFIKGFSPDMRNPVIYGKQKLPRKVEKIYCSLRLNNTRPAQGFAKWSPFCTQCGKPAGPRHLLFTCPAHAPARAVLRDGLRSDMMARKEENKCLRPVQRKKVVHWRDDAILQESTVRVGTYLQAILPTLPFFDHLDLAGA